MAIVSNASLASRVSDVITKWERREKQYDEWQAGAATGGPFADGRFPITSYTGDTTYVASPAAIAAKVDGPASTIMAKAAEILAAALSADQSATSAQASADLATSMRDAAQAASLAADQSYQGAVGAEANAQVHRGYAESAASAASASAAAAAQSETNLQTAVDATSASATAAASSAADSASSAAEAYASALTAQQLTTGLLTYRGSFDASTGSFPANSVQGDFWKISVAGTVAGTDLAVGDQIIYSGTGWDKIDNTETVTAVAGRVGNVVLSSADIGDLQGLLDAKAPLANPTFATTLTMDGSAFLTRGWGGAANNGVLLFGDNTSYILKSGPTWTFHDADNGVSATLSSSGSILTTGSLDTTKLLTDGTAGESRLDPATLQSTTLRSGIIANNGQGLLNAAGSATALAGWWHVINMYHDTNGYGAQIAVELSSTATNAMYLRSSSGTNWREWTKVWTDANFNPEVSGIGFGSHTGASATDLSKHIRLYGSSYGLSITGNTINYVAGGGIHNFINSAGTSSRVQCGDVYKANANSAALVRQPRVFVQSADPGAAAADGDLWIW